MKKLLIIYDAEGLPGIRTWQDVVTDFHSDNPTRKLKQTTKKTLDQVVAGAEQAGYSDIVILDWHATKQNIPRDKIAKAKGTKLVIHEGTPQMYKKYLSDASCAILIGMHGKYGSADGNPPMNQKEFREKTPNGIAHVWAFSIKDFSINGRARGESVLLHSVLAEHNVPVAFVLGTRSAIYEIKKYDPQVQTLSNSCKYDTIRKSVTSSLKDLPKVKPTTFRSIRIDFKQHKDEATDQTRILAHKNIFEEKYKDLKVTERSIELTPKSRTPFLESFYMLALEEFK